MSWGGAVVAGWAAASLAGIASLVYWVWLAFWRPSRWPRLAVSASSVAAVLTLLALYYAGFYTLLAWMPDSWGWVSRSSDGDQYVTIRSAIAFGLALAGTGASLRALDTYAQAMAISERNRAE